MICIEVCFCVWFGVIIRKHDSMLCVIIGCSEIDAGKASLCFLNSYAKSICVLKGIHVMHPLFLQIEWRPTCRCRFIVICFCQKEWWFSHCLQCIHNSIHFVVLMCIQKWNYHCYGTQGKSAFLSIGGVRNSTLYPVGVFLTILSRMLFINEVNCQRILSCNGASGKIALRFML